MDRFKELQVLFNGIGFVPRNTIKKIQKKYKNATELFLNSFDLSDTEKSELRFAAEVDKLKASPNADKRIYRKEVEVRRLISKIENDIALWKNNIEFFAKSKTADKVREEFNEKIAKATAQLEELKEELKVLNKI
jgi:predicted ribosome quality control (RQC) complex YloA/Tae2 family protein